MALKGTRLGFTLDIDFNDFNDKLKKIIQEIVPACAVKGMARAGMQLLNDAVMQRPTVPIKEGYLRGSGNVFVQNTLVHTSKHGKPGKGRISLKRPIKENEEIVADVSFNLPYAARLHEGEGLHFSEPSAGPKFLESKMSRNKYIYFKIIANAIR